MKVLKKFAFGFLMLLALGTAQAVDVAGVKVDEAQNISGAQLTLNGAGVRYKAIFKVYVAALYVGKKTTSAAEVLSQPGPKRISVTMLRNIDANELGKLFSRGMEDNMGKAEMSKMIPGLLRMGEMFAAHKKLVAGDTFSLDWVPGKGSVVTVKGQVQGEPFKEPEFFRALMSIWLGSSPADYQLKEALLGSPSTR